jgi:hypothetical protein
MLQAPAPFVAQRKTWRPETRMSDTVFHPAKTRLHLARLASAFAIAGMPRVLFLADSSVV